jgi:transposase
MMDARLHKRTSDREEGVWMRGEFDDNAGMFSYITPAQRVPKDHPLRPIRDLVNAALKELSPVFQKLYSRIGRPSIPPERLIRASVLQMLYSIRSERQLMEQLNFNILYRWFVGLDLDDRVWDVTVYTKNRARLLRGQVDVHFFNAILEQARAKGLISEEHFTVDGTLIEAWASQKSFQRKDRPKPPSNDPGNPSIDFRGEKRTNETHESKTDPQSRLFRKARGHEAKLCYMGHALMENRNGLAVGGVATLASGYAEREAALELLASQQGASRWTLAADKAYDQADFVAALRDARITPHVAQNTSNRSSSIDGRTTRHSSYAISQKRRMRVEEIFGWLKTVASLRKVKHRGRRLVDWVFRFGLGVYNLVRIRNLTAEMAG